MPAHDDWRPLYPFESHYLQLDGLRYHYLDEGQGPAVLLVHGNPTWSFYWREVIKALRPHYRVIVPDHIGCGLSDKPSASQYSFRLAQRVDDLGRLIEHLDLRDIALVAHDWGGAVGMGAAVAMPDRFARFTLMNTAAFLAAHCPRRIRLCHVPLLAPLAAQGLNLFVHAAIRMAPAHPERLTPAVRAGLMAPYDSWRNRTAVLRFAMDIPLQTTHPTYQTLLNIERGLPQFADRPICFIWGMRDWCFTPDFLDRFLQFYPNAEVHRLDDAGHYLIEDDPEQVIGILAEFLDRTGQRA